MSKPLGRQIEEDGRHIAPSRAAFKSGDWGYRRERKIYFLCPFHCEKTPSCVLNLTDHEVRWYRADIDRLFIAQRSAGFFMCYGCMAQGNRRKLYSALASPARHRYGPPHPGLPRRIGLIEPESTDDGSLPF